MTYKIIQLSHPGKEWPDFSDSENSFVKSRNGLSWNKDYTGGIRDWNNLNQHKRKFILSKNATYIDNLQMRAKQGDITFWGEWEPHSKFSVISKSSKNFFGPRMMHIPFYYTDYDGPRRHTTDPFVYGKNFWYTHCKQSSSKPNQNLKNLGTHCIILMGSERNVDKTFLIDTIFVVKQKYSQEDINKNLDKLSYLLKETNLKVNYDLLNDNKSADFGFYKGENYLTNEIFSFVPAKIFNEKNPGHERLEIKTDDKFYNFQRTGAGSVNKTVLSTLCISEIREYWRKIVNETLRQGFVLGVCMPEPKCKNCNCL